MLHVLDDYLCLLEEKNLTDPDSLRSPLLAQVRHTPINCLTYDSRLVKSSALFIVKGAHFTPQFLIDAQAAGAIAYVVDRSLAPTLANTVTIPAIPVTNIRHATLALGQLFFDNSTNKLTTVGITGTKGKSTTTYFVRYILEKWLRSQKLDGPAILSSINNYDGITEEESHLTTPEPLELYQHFSNAHHAGITHMVMEVSSQALKYERVCGMRFAIAAFTNIGEDHISPSEHSSFDDYYESKLRIFKQADTAIVNSDAMLAERTIAHARAHCPTLTYGSHPEDSVYCPPESISTDVRGIHFSAHSPWYSSEEFTISMPGLFNVSNALCAITICGVLGVPEEYVREGLQAAQAPGRMQRYISDDKKVVVLVDYAHNKLSFESVLSSMHNEYPEHTLLAVFGSTGGKALDRRKDMGEAVSQYCTHEWITEDDNYYEPFESIAADIAQYVTIPHTINENRAECIRKAILDGTAQDDTVQRVVLLLGKGLETTHVRGSTYVEVPSDNDYALRFLAEYNAAHPASIRERAV